MQNNASDATIVDRLVNVDESASILLDLLNRSTTATKNPSDSACGDGELRLDVAGLFELVRLRATRKFAMTDT